MIKEKTVVGVILARGGSKGLPGKNIKKLGRKPLIAYSVESAKQSKYLDRVILTTDSVEIAEIGKRYGAETPFIRPKHLARDSTHTPPVIEHAINHLEKREGFRTDIVVVLQPTTPFRTPAHIDQTVEVLVSNPRLQSAMTVRPAAYPPHWMFWGKDGKLFPFVNDGTDYSLKERQQLPTLYQPNGAVYVCYRELLAEKGVLFSAYLGATNGFVVMDPLSSVDIDGELDFAVAETVLKFLKRK